MAAPTRAMRVCILSRSFSRGAVVEKDFAAKERKPNLNVNHKLDFDPKVQELISSGEATYKNHPGIVNVKYVKLPQRLEDAIKVLAERYPTPDLQKNATKFTNYLWSRATPIDEADVPKKIKEVEQRVLERENLDFDTMKPEEIEAIKPKLQKKAEKLWKKTSQFWKPIEYNAYEGFLYLVGRVANDYSTLYRIFHEIQMRDPKFKPWTVFDFGSGVGTSIWAANAIWNYTIKEHYCVDVSEDMNTIARLLLQGGEEARSMYYNGVYFRQFFPLSTKNKFDLVVCSFVLNDLSSREERLKVVLSLWRKTHKYLVLVENGTNPGFSLVSEARDLILQLKQHRFGRGDHTVTEDLTGHVFAPCPHDSPCPRLLRRDGNPCHFEVGYQPLIVKGKRQTDKAASRFSYIVLQKGPRDQSEVAWPRIVKPVSTPSKCVHCRTCTPTGELEHSILTASKHGKDFYRCVRKCTWGDLIPGTSPVWEEKSNLTYQSLGNSMEGRKAGIESVILDSNRVQTEKMLHHEEELEEEKVTNFDNMSILGANSSEKAQENSDFDFDSEDSDSSKEEETVVRS